MILNESMKCIVFLGSYIISLSVRREETRINVVRSFPKGSMPSKQSFIRVLVVLERKEVEKQSILH